MSVFIQHGDIVVERAPDGWFFIRTEEGNWNWPSFKGEAELVDFCRTLLAVLSWPT